MVRKILELLDRRERAQAYTLLAMIVLMSIIEILGIASILPFMAVLADPGVVQSNTWLRAGYEALGFTSTNHYLFALGLLVLLVLLASNAVKAITRWATLYYSHMWGNSVSCRLFDTYLSQPYPFFLQRNSADIAKNILAEVQTLTNNVIIASLDMLARVLVSVVVLGLLLVIDPLLASVTFVVLGGAYVVVYMLLRRILLVESERRKFAQGERYKIVNEAFHGVKNLKLSGYEKLYGKYFAAPSRIFARSMARNSLVGEMPRYALEVIAFGGILLITLYLLLRSDRGISEALPMIALYAFAGYRLMPGLQGIYGALTKIRFHMPVLDVIRGELALGHAAEDSNVAAVPFTRAIRFDQVGFCYQGGDRNVLRDVNFSIPAQAMIGIIGRTGSGKTTMIDLMLGLLQPSTGHILVDDVAVDDENRRAWQKNLSYVSQHIYLCDDTIASNIAFGVPPDQIDMNRVKRAATMACLDAFIETELEQGYKTVVGENGIRLSGGQRQRIGLARALYLDRPVLVLDEATSALDPATETAVMQAIHGLGRQKTIIMISHRLELLARCDSIYIVRDGTVTQGRIDPALDRESESFRQALMSMIAEETEQ